MSSIIHYAKVNGDCVIQKYLEYPLLIENRKFDIRQWFMVTNWNPLKLWIFHGGYARFCSTEFSLDDKNCNIHLTNQAIQSPEKHFNPEKSLKSASIIPSDNIWSYDDLENWLDENFDENEWQGSILPGIWEIIAQTCKRNAPFVKHLPGAYEIYGADIGKKFFLQKYYALFSY